MKVEAINGNLVITLPLQPPTPSASGKTFLVATSNGTQKTSVLIEGKPVTVGVNAFIKR